MAGVGFRKRITVSALACVAALSLTREADALNRCEVLAHAKQWVDAGIMYSQGPGGGYCPGSLYCDPTAGGACYRPDCSGFVSAVWGLAAPGHTTYSFAGGPWDSGNSHVIGLDELKPGDALNYPGSPSAGTGHIVLFGGWLDGVGGKLWAYETGVCGTPAHYSERSWSSMSGSYLPIRLNGIADSSDAEKCDAECQCSPRLDAKFVGQGSDAPADDEGKAYYEICAGADVSFWFELENTGADSWVDSSGESWGQSVRLGVPDDSPDPFVGKNRISLNEATNNDVHPASRVVFSTGPASPAKAPSTPGVYNTTWQLVDEGRAWFGPEMYLSFNVVACDTTETGSGGSGGNGGGGWGNASGKIPPSSGGASSKGNQKTSVYEDESDSGCACEVGASSPSLDPRAWLLIAALGALFRRRA